MRLVVDTNILFTYFWKNSFTRKLLLKNDLELFSPEYSLKEIKIYMQEILEKAKISKQEFIKLRKELAQVINFISLEEYKVFLKEAFKLSVDEKDVDFMALALKLNCSIWSKDLHLKQQDRVKVFTTEELVNLLL